MTRYLWFTIRGLILGVAITTAHAAPVSEWWPAMLIGGLAMIYALMGQVEIAP